MTRTLEVYFPGGKRVDAKFGDFTVHTDQSLEKGGDGSAPAPFQLFVASVATCAGIYALEFCKAREIPLEGMALRVSYDWDAEKHRTEKLHIELKVPPGFPDRYKKAVAKAMDLCSVKKHIVHPPEFITTVN